MQLHIVTEQKKSNGGSVRSDCYLCRKIAPEGKLMDLLCYCCTAGHIIGARQSLFKTASGALAQHRLISRPALCPRNHQFVLIADHGSSLSISGKLSVLHLCRTRPYLELSNRPGCICPGERARCGSVTSQVTICRARRATVSSTKEKVVMVGVCKRPYGLQSKHAMGDDNDASCI